jgi:hypothetical protein
MLRHLIGLVWILTVTVCGHARAQEAVLDETYGAGVHAYFAGAHRQAADALTAAIDGGMKDARAYYFRGLTHAKMGLLDAAEADFAQGAALESAEPEMTTVVSRALQRVQGQTRLRVEAHRTKARFAVLSQQRARDQTRYGRERTEERRTLTQQADKAATAEEGVFEEKVAPAEGKKAEEKVVEETEEKAVEKTEPAKPADAPDPFGDETAPKAESKTKPAEKTDEPAATADDPFGEQPKAKEEAPAAKEEAPAAKEEAPAVKEEEMPAEEAPAEKVAPAVKKPAEKKA